MPGRFSAGKTLKDESGAVLVIMAVFVVIMTLLFAGLAEFGRYLILKEQLQTAGDAAALAGMISGGRRYVEIEVTTDPGEKWESDTDCWTECDEEGNCHTVCDTDWWCEECGDTTTRTVVGEERKLIDAGGWRDYCIPPCGDCGGYSCDYELIDRWVEYEDPSLKGTAKDIFNANPIDQAIQAEIEDIEIKDGKMGTAPYVLVYARSRMKSLFPGLFGVFPETYEVKTCSQGDTTYIDPETGEWVEAPPDVCWQE